MVMEGIWKGIQILDVSWKISLNKKCLLRGEDARNRRFEFNIILMSGLLVARLLLHRTNKLISQHNPQRDPSEPVVTSSLHILILSHPSDQEQLPFPLIVTSHV
jgi:hypothetical protein